MIMLHYILVSLHYALCCGEKFLLLTLITLSIKEPFIATYCYRSGNILAIIVPNRASGSCPDPEILGTGSRKVYEGAAA
jgi:hypothetical protein